MSSGKIESEFCLFESDGDKSVIWSLAMKPCLF
jgi:hypothetical protein